MQMSTDGIEPPPSGCKPPIIPLDYALVWGIEDSNSDYVSPSHGCYLYH